MTTKAGIDLANADAARALLAAIVDSADDAIISKTLDGVITSWNKAAEGLFGYTATEAIGQPVLMLIPQDRQGEEAEILAKLRRGERIDHYETMRRRKDGQLIRISLTISPVRDASGTIIGASKIARDIGQQRQLEEERDALLASERAARTQAEHLSAVKDEFLATLSHELRTPLSAVLGWAQVLMRPNRTEADLSQGLDTIERNARIQAQMIEDLLDMSRIISGKVALDIQPLEPASFLEAAVHSLRPSADSKGVRIELLLDPHAGPMRGDPSRLQQVAWNLLSNAIKFTPRGGKVQVVLRKVASHIEIVIADTGIGIAPEFLPYVFDRFRQADASTTRQHGGLGIGLSLVKRLVELHNGSVVAESAGARQGATFTVRLPIAVLRPSEPRGGNAQEQPARGEFLTMDLSGVRVLVVDDEPDARAMVHRILLECEAIVATAGSAGEALQVLDRGRPDILLTDIGMPGMDGYEFLRRWREAERARGIAPVPAIALTAFARSEDRTRALRAGFMLHVAKPVEASELIASVAAAGRSLEARRG